MPQFDNKDLNHLESNEEALFWLVTINFMIIVGFVLIVAGIADLLDIEKPDQLKKNSS